MASSSSSSSLCFFTLALLLFATLLMIRPANADATDEIETICRSMEEYGFCYNFFYQNLNPPQASKADVVGVTIAAAKSNATGSLAFIRDALVKKPLDDDTKNSLTVCENAYDILVKTFTAAEDSFNKHDYGDVIFEERGTPRAQSSCQIIWFALDNMMTGRNRLMRMLIAMALEAAYILTYPR